MNIMVEKISVNPVDVRCLGNIISPSKSTSDFNRYNGAVTTATVTVAGVTRRAYTVDYLVGSSLSLSYSTLISPSASSFSVSATLKDNNESSVSSVTVYCNVNDTVYSARTNSSGVATFDIPTDGSSRYIFKVYYNGKTGLAGSVANGTVYTGSITDVRVASDSTITDNGDTNVHLIAIATDTGKGVKGATIKFYKE